MKQIKYEGHWSEPINRGYGRIEWNCVDGIGHGEHAHGCDGCCKRNDYPGKKDPR